MSDAAIHPAVLLAQDLIRCPSVTPAEGGALTLLASHLAAAGFSVERVTFSAPGTPDVDNLYARYGTGAPLLVFAGHTDVVPTGDVARWRHDPFAGEIVDGRLYGRGACDMKGGVAAMVTAATDFIAAHPSFGGSIAFLLTGDEEGPAVNGTVKLLEWAKARGEQFSHCILGEPTNPASLGDMIKIGRRGSLTGRLTVTGRQGHVGYPHLALNPLPTLLRALEALTGPALDDGTAHFDPSNLEVTTVDVGNPATNLIPGEAKAVFNVRFNDRWTLDSLKAEIEGRLARARREGDAEVSLTFDYSNAVAFLTNPGPFVDIVSAAVEAVTGRRPALSTTGGTSDARFIQACCPVVEFGPVGGTMHQVDEFVAVDDLASLTAIYRGALERYFGP
ncbi:succinyl-diaminopimelate desuccinylase [Pseudochelatococcus lubricantis]|uniref:succinyl-diaminopimelate desuccinylase n=1 Tax=Pseudochelatococcus lubricantis TaxID=1538102 RepID=UPI0035E8DDE3